MEHIKGYALGELWDTLKPKQKESVEPSLILDQERLLGRPLLSLWPPVIMGDSLGFGS
jgi:predicted Ser/Thr protein kinase